MPPPASHGASATAAFYKALESGVPHNGRRVKIDYSQSATPHDKGRLTRGNLNDGTRDIGNAQSPVLLFRGLDPLSGPQAIYQSMLSSSGPGKEGAKGMRRIILIKDKVTMASFGFAFVEFVDVQVCNPLRHFFFAEWLTFTDRVNDPGSNHVPTITPLWFPHLGSTRGSFICTSILISTRDRLPFARRSMPHVYIEPWRR